MTAELVDAHLHLWDRSRLCYPWMDGMDPPQQSLPTAAEHGNPRHCAVIVEAGAMPAQRRAEVDWLATLATPYAGLVAMVAAVDYTAADCDQLIEHWAQTRFVHGVRDNFEARAPGALNTAANRHGVLAALAAGLSVDVCVRAGQWPELQDFLRAIVAVRGDAAGMVIDHLGKPDVAAGDTVFAAWRQAVEALAKVPGLMIKVSGLGGQVDGDVSVAQLRRLVQRYAVPAVAAFGTERAMLGSDHPVSTSAHGLERVQWERTAMAVLHDAFGDAAAPVRGATACTFYRLR